MIESEDSLAQVMREILIQLMNKRTGYDPTTGENPATAEDFWTAQADVVRLRQKVLTVYGKQVFKPDVDVYTTAQIAQALYKLVIDDGVSIGKVCTMGHKRILSITEAG